MNRNLCLAKKRKNDEFYTQYEDVEKELSAYNPNLFKNKTILLPCDNPEWSNFTKYFLDNFYELGLLRLISTSYPDGKSLVKDAGFKPYFFNLEGDGDFRSEEVTALRDEADFIITNPPFSLFREFLAWIVEADKKFLILGSMNAITYKEVFPLIKSDKLWAGTTPWSGGMWFETVNLEDVDRVRNGINFKNVPSIWLTNIEHGRRHEPLVLDTMENNLRFSNNKFIREFGYPQYDNYNAIEVAATNYIPNDYQGIMGVPISFLDKYCPEQFEILGLDDHRLQLPNWRGRGPTLNGKTLYRRVIIRHR